ncbi:hypothetical protein NEHOM01_0808 [Nematocida homosporus]|uniref:uncharacterized protein n=1 Tax=Nematocida homosporus TaxID=1912981 RepID=UPI00221F31A0|nr:uncharacterized protein NEHOM01_0808 [Nematocida homosporus]KAI5185393.1 hypothetical protein NEHOM01_0808 [Nematocida homosporus]
MPIHYHYQHLNNQKKDKKPIVSLSNPFLNRILAETVAKDPETPDYEKSASVEAVPVLSTLTSLGLVTSINLLYLLFPLLLIYIYKCSRVPPPVNNAASTSIKPINILINLVYIFVMILLLKKIQSTSYVVQNQADKESKTFWQKHRSQLIITVGIMCFSSILMAVLGFTKVLALVLLFSIICLIITQLLATLDLGLNSYDTISAKARKKRTICLVILMSIFFIFFIGVLITVMGINIKKQALLNRLEELDRKQPVT